LHSEEEARISFPLYFPRLHLPLAQPLPLQPLRALEPQGQELADLQEAELVAGEDFREAEAAQREAAVLQ
jgi:hypothetical protein